MANVLILYKKQLCLMLISVHIPLHSVLRFIQRNFFPKNTRVVHSSDSMAPGTGQALQDIKLCLFLLIMASRASPKIFSPVLLLTKARTKYMEDRWVYLFWMMVPCLLLMMKPILFGVS